ncbi:argininosuccinate lyase [Clostridia bacterium]|nr:argininosuccinate lyase [Clostridia bacterium]
MASDAKMWAGRFKKELDSTVNDFNSSVRFDSRMWVSDIEGSCAHAEMLGDCGIITKDESAKIISALIEIKQDIKSGTLDIDYSAEDIHMFIEAELTRRIGDTGKKLHTARSRNDQVAVDIRLYLREEISVITALIKDLISVITDTAEAHIDTLFPGVTHLQHAQPIVFAHHILAYAAMFTRDIGRLRDASARMNVNPLGACALAGTTHPIDTQITTGLLGFASAGGNSVDSVSDRDFAIEIASALSVVMMHLSRFSEEIILWASSEYGFITLDDAFSTGSSIMPQKKNPDVAELARGKTGRVYGDLMALLTVMKGLPLAYNKDMQEDKEAIFDAVDTVKQTLPVFTGMLKTIRVNADVMAQSAARGFLNATDLADYFVRRGLPFRDAYKLSGTIVGVCVERGIALGDLSLSDYKAECKSLGLDANLIGEDIYDSLDLLNCVGRRKSFGGPSRENIERQIKFYREGS